MIIMHHRIQGILEDNHQTSREFWVCAFAWRTVVDKILRNVPPTRVIISCDTLSRHYSKLNAREVGSNKQVNLSSNAYGADCVIFDEYQECAQYYNNTIIAAVEKFNNDKMKFIEKIDKNMQVAQNSLIPGYINRIV